MPGKNEQKLIELVTSVYEAGLDSSRWPALLNKVSSVVGAEVGSVWIHDFNDGSADVAANEGNVAAFIGFDESAIASFAAYYSAVNVWTANEDKLQSGTAVTGSSLYPDELLPGTEFYNDFLRPQDLFYTLGSVVERRDSRAVKMSFLRSKSSGAYGEQELGVMQQLMPHMQCAIAMHRKMCRLQSLAQSAMTVLDSLPYGVILLTSAGSLLYANSAATEISKRTGALRLGAGGTIHAATQGGTLKLRSLVADAIETGRGAGTRGAGALRVMGPKADLQLLVAPMPARAAPFGEPVAAAILFSDPAEAPIELSHKLQVLYGMTPAEAAVTEALVNGTSLKAIADARRTSLNTIKTQFKTAAAKAGAKRQVDLVRIILSGPALLRSSKPTDAS